MTLFAAQGGKCVYCRCDLDDTAHVDHRMPLSLGGTNTDDNVQLLCAWCNNSKHNTHPDVYEARIGYVRPGAPTAHAAQGQHAACAFAEPPLPLGGSALPSV